MTQARKRLVSLADTPYYHCISRCVRRAFLCGRDHVTGRDCSHRRAWIENRLFELSGIFAIKLCAYAVMSNHYHVVIQVNRECATSWTLDEVLERWTQLFSGPALVQRHLDGVRLTPEECSVLKTLAETYRERLYDLSWFMRCVNEPLARQANLEDGCTGRFWEGRFKSQALLDERALLSCMAYVDLNPIRAGIARTPEHSEFTSIRTRIRADSEHQPNGLLALDPQNESALPYRHGDYLELVDWAGRAVGGKKGHILEDLPPILERLDLEPRALKKYLTRSKTPFYRVIGPLEQVRAMATRLGRYFFKGSLEAAGLLARPG